MRILNYQPFCPHMIICQQNRLYNLRILEEAKANLKKGETVQPEYKQCRDARPPCTSCAPPELFCFKNKKALYSCIVQDLSYQLS